MQLKVIGSSSAGNSYILETHEEALIIECGVRFHEIKQALNFNLRKVVGCLITHEHNDHSKWAREIMLAGIDLYCSGGTLKALKLEDSHRTHTLVEHYPQRIGSFNILPFKVLHDTAEPFGFLIYHQECGTTLFLTDSIYSPYTFRNLNNIIVEANYCPRILDERMKEDKKFLRDRIINSHFSIDNCKDMLKANDLSQVNNIVLIHLSDGNSDGPRFKREVAELTGKTVHIAGKGLAIPFDKTPF